MLNTEETYPKLYREFIHRSRYARWIDTKNRREDWEETAMRYMDFMRDHLLENNNYRMPKELYEELYEAILNHQVLPSMRALMTAGEALQRDSVAAYNCSYLPIDNVRAFSEAVYILMCGTGVGFSVESTYTEQLPEVPDAHYKSPRVIIVEDSKYGWSNSFLALLNDLYIGNHPEWDTSAVREAGARLKTFGGRASGPGPLEDLFEFTVKTFMQAQGRRLKPIEVFDIMCKVGEVVVSGGVRRSALLCLSDLYDDEMRNAKSGEWWHDNPQRALANVSTAYEERPSEEVFVKEWNALYNSGSGERGIFNREAADNQILKNHRRGIGEEWGTNPCSEIILRPKQLCNLTSVVVRPEDSLSELSRKVELATILGTFQSTITDFKILREDWKKNTEEERLLGVSMTGQMGNKFLNGSEGKGILTGMLQILKNRAIVMNMRVADELGIPRSAAITCVKPEGTSSQLVGTASGMHPWHSKYFIRTVRGGKEDPMTQYMIDQGIPHEDDVMAPDKRVVFSFPVRAPEGAMVRDSLSAIEHLELWQIYQKHWCEHKPSITVSIKDDEWGEVGLWVWHNFDEISGIAFLPYEDHSYKQAPYQSITREEYEELMDKFPNEVNFTGLELYESDDNTTGSQTLSCTGNVCEMVDVGKEG